MIKEITEALELQKYWTHTNTLEMQRRGTIVRDEIPAWLESQTEAISKALGINSADLEIEGKDGTGRKTEIPWIRFCSLSHSPNPREGWYCVYLFQAGGEGFYLTLNQGTTKWENGEFKPKPKKDLATLVDWARKILADDLANLKNSVMNISLGAKGDLGEAYENGTVAAIWYPREMLPSSEEFSADLISFSKLLGKLYNAEDLGRSLESTQEQAQSFQEAVKITIESRSIKARRGQGFGLTPLERVAVEAHSMAVAQDYLLKNFYTLQDVSKTHSYDFLATKEGVQKIVEIKGTTSAGESIILTANEVAIHNERYPQNMLIIVHSIALDRKENPPLATGGIIEVVSPWAIKTNNLKPLAYQYVLDKISS